MRCGATRGLAGTSRVADCPSGWSAPAALDTPTAAHSKHIFESTEDCGSRRSWGCCGVLSLAKVDACYANASRVELSFRSCAEASPSGSSADTRTTVKCGSNTWVAQESGRSWG